MKRFFLSSALALSLATTAALAQQTAPQSNEPTQPSAESTAQQPAGHNGHHLLHRKMDPQKAAQHLGKRLNLSADQTAKLEPIFADRQQKMQALHSNTSLTKDQRRDQARTIARDTHDQLAQILTPEQMQQLKSMHRGFRGGRHQQPQQQPESTTPPSNS